MARRATKAARERREEQRAAMAKLRMTACLLALQAEAAYKREHEPLSVPGELSEKVKRAVYGALYAFLEYLASHSSGGASANPLRKSSPEWEGAFVAINHRDELGYVCEPYLFGAALSHLFGVRPPPVDEYCRHKGSESTPKRDAYEAYWLLDETSGTYCEVHALSGEATRMRAAGRLKTCVRRAASDAPRPAAARPAAALMHHFNFTLTRAEKRKIFVYRTQSPAALVGIDLVELLRVLKAHNTVTQDCTEAQMCDMLLAPFRRVFVNGRKALLAGLCKIKHAKINWKKRLARVKADRKAQAARKALIEREEEAAKVAREAALSAAVAAKPRASGARKKRAASTEEDTAAKKQKTARDTTTPCVPFAEADTADTAEESSMLNGALAFAGAQDAAYAQVQAAQAMTRVAREVGVMFGTAEDCAEDTESDEDERHEAPPPLTAEELEEEELDTDAFFA